MNNTGNSYNPTLINFSWVDNYVAGFAYPNSEAALLFLSQQGIKHIISLSRDPAPPLAESLGMKVHHLPIIDFNIPDFETIDRFLSIIRNAKQANEKVGVHCKYGIGRTGTMLAIYFIEEHGMTPRDALIHVRKLRPGSVESVTQQQFILTYKRNK